MRRWVEEGVSERTRYDGRDPGVDPGQGHFGQYLGRMGSKGSMTSWPQVARGAALVRGARKAAEALS